MWGVRCFPKRHQNLQNSFRRAPLYSMWPQTWKTRKRNGTGTIKNRKNNNAAWKESGWKGTATLRDEGDDAMADGQWNVILKFFSEIGFSVRKSVWLGLCNVVSFWVPSSLTSLMSERIGFCIYNRFFSHFCWFKHIFSCFSKVESYRCFMLFF